MQYGGCCGPLSFLEEEDQQDAKFLAISYGWDSDYINWLRGSIPLEMRNRIQIRDDVSPDERLKLLQTGVSVIPSIYESLCLFAYESAMMGNKVILNGLCPAFGPNTPWSDDENCLIFDGSPKDLAKQMQKALSWQPTSTVLPPTSPAYWLQAHATGTNVSPGHQALDHKKKCSLAIIHYGFSSHFEARAFAKEHNDKTPNSEATKHYLALPKSVENSVDFSTIGLPVLPLSGKSILPSDLWQAACTVEEECLLLLPADVQVESAFACHAQALLASNPNLVGLAGFTAFLDGQGKTVAIKPVASECKTGALVSDAGLDIGLVLRRSLVRRYPFEDQARQDWYRVFSRQLLLADEPIPVMPEIAVRQTADILQRAEKRQITTSLAASSNCLPRDISPFGLKIDIAPKRTMEDMTPKQRFLTFYGGHRLHPSRAMVDFEPVQFRKDNNDLLVHALNNEIVVARLPIENGGMTIKEAIVQVAHKGNDQSGVEIAFWLSPNTLSAYEASIQRCPHRSDWITLQPKENTEIALRLPQAMDELNAYVAVRLPDGADQSRAWTTVTGLRVLS